MSICLTWVPFCELGEPKLYHNLEDFTRMRDITWRVSDCEELVGVTQEMMGLVLGGFYLEGSEYGS